MPCGATRPSHTHTTSRQSPKNTVPPSSHVEATLDLFGRGRGAASGSRGGAGQEHSTAPTARTTPARSLTVRGIGGRWSRGGRETAYIFRPRATTCDTMWQLAAHANTRLMHQRHCVPCTTGWKWGDGRTARLRPTPNVFRALALPLLRLSSAFWEGRGGWRHRSRSGAPAFLVHPL